MRLARSVLRLCPPFLVLPSSLPSPSHPLAPSLVNLPLPTLCPLSTLSLSFSLCLCLCFCLPLPLSQIQEWGIAFGLAMETFVEGDLNFWKSEIITQLALNLETDAETVEIWADQVSEIWADQVGQPCHATPHYPVQHTMYPTI